MNKTQVLFKFLGEIMKILDKKQKQVYELSALYIKKSSSRHKWLLTGKTPYGSIVIVDTFETEEEAINVFNNLTNNMYFDYIVQGGN